MGWCAAIQGGRERVLRTAATASRAIACAVAIGACGASATAATTHSGSLVGVREANFRISTVHSVTAGRITFDVANAGPDRHEFNIVALGSGLRAGRLPLRADGFTVNEELLASRELASVAPQEPGHSTQLTVTLPPGRYVLFCNMEGHYMAGMFSELTVTR